MFRLENFDLSDVNSSPEPLEKLKGILRQTIGPDLTDEEFMSYLFGIYPDSLQMSFIYDKKELAGFCTSSAYPIKLRQKKMVILRSAFGLRDEYKEGNFPLHGLFFKYITYKLKHLFTPVYVAGFMANPLMYSMICKYTLTSYPRNDEPVPEKISEVKKRVLQSMSLSQEEAPFVLKIHFQVRFNGRDIERFHSSSDEHVQYFLSINPGYNHQMGVLVIIPVTLFNMSYTFFRYVGRKIRKKLFSDNHAAEKSKPLSRA